MDKVTINSESANGGLQNIILYCRAGFEKECAAEISDKAAQQGITGFARLQEQSGYVVFRCSQVSEAMNLIHSLPFSSLIFARQLILAGDLLPDLPATDRLTPIVRSLHHQSLPADELRVEVADTNASRQLLKFCRKFTVPARRELRMAGLLTNRKNKQPWVMHLFFTAPGCCYAGYSYRENHSPFYMGIPRLRLPADAPSRSTLKLEEAFHVFIPADEWPQRLANSMSAVDLGASPGGWSYQLVRRNMWVSAIDNGPLAQSLLDSGLVTWLQQDGFTYRPSQQYNWMVCDIVDKPARVTALVAQWLINGWCQETIFNLKLPMKKRYQNVIQNMDALQQQLQVNGIWGTIQARQLYHDREEITVHIRRQVPK